MDDTRAKEFIKKVFESEFSKESFTLFIRNLLNKFDESKAFHAHGYVKEIFTPHIKTYERLGTYTDPNNNKIDILIVYLQKETSIERARSMQRNFVAEYLKGRDSKDAALVAFVSPDPSDWRFSFVKMEYEMKIAENGKVKVSNTFTPVKRYSFLVGPHEASHTAQSRMLPHLKNSVTHPTLAELEELFSVEKVTNEFFDEYKELFADLVDSFSHNDEFVKSVVSKYGIDVADFSKKLMGQIVFLYFLQKKGWLGVKEGAKWGTGDKYFMTNLYKSVYGSYANFFNDILEPLFYDTLNRRDRGNSSVTGDQSWSPRFQCKIPYLNGGLFTPAYEWEKTNIKIENERFQKIFEVFDRYNFTVYEPDPIEKEVAVDPEMLGKVFERLLDVKDRKGKGAFYTPREIVQYMCRESLITYLKNNSDIEEDRIRSFFERKDHELGDTDIKRAQILTDESLRDRANTMYELLKKVKICDPAVGSGAFPMGLLKEISSARHYLNTFFIKEQNTKGQELTEYDIKKQTLENCIYGVDIEPGAVEIARLRFWLALIVEHDIEDVEPLPNLDYKIMQGNSLLEDLVVGGSSIKLNLSKLIKTDGRTKEMKNLFEEEEQGKLFLDQTDNIIQSLRQYHAEYFRQNDPEKKKVLKNKIDAKEDELIQSGCEEEIKRLNEQMEYSTDEMKKAVFVKQINKIKHVLSKWNLDHIRPFFPWKLHFGEVFEQGGFDIIIANPPYIKEYVNKNAFDGLRESTYYQGKMDIWYFFACESIDLVKQNTGIVTLIAQNNWVTSYGASRMRNKVIAETQIVKLIDFGDFKVFDAGIQTMVMVFNRNNILETYNFDYRRVTGNNISFKHIPSILNKQSNVNAEYLKPVIKRDDLKNRILTFSNSKVEALLNKLSAIANFQLDATKEVAQGIVPNPDVIGVSNIEKIPQNKMIKYGIKKGDGVFVVPNNYFDNVSLNEYELDTLKPIYEPNDIDKYCIKHPSTKRIMYITKLSDDSKLLNLISHLEKYREIMDDRRENINGRLKYFHLHWPRDEYFFKEGPKILSVRKCAYPTFAYTEKEAYVMMSLNVIRTNRINMKYLTALLNSKLFIFWLKHKGKMQGNNYQIDKEPLLGLPIFNAPNNKQAHIIEVLDQIIGSIKSSHPELVNTYEKQINSLVYKLYELTDEEISIIETCS